MNILRSYVNLFPKLSSRLESVRGIMINESFQVPPPHGAGNGWTSPDLHGSDPRGPASPPRLCLLLAGPGVPSGGTSSRLDDPSSYISYCRYGGPPSKPPLAFGRLSPSLPPAPSAFPALTALTPALVPTLSKSFRGLIRFRLKEAELLRPCSTRTDAEASQWTACTRRPATLSLPLLREVSRRSRGFSHALVCRLWSSESEEAQVSVQHPARQVHPCFHPAGSDLSLPGAPVSNLGATSP